MTGPDTLLAAARALTHNGSPLYVKLAAWLEQQADELNLRTAIWRRTGQDVGLLTNSHYHYPLAVARAVLEPEEDNE